MYLMWRKIQNRRRSQTT